MSHALETFSSNKLTSHGAHLVCFLSFQNHCPSVHNLQNLKTVVLVFFFFSFYISVVSSNSMNFFPVNSPWSEVSCIGFYSASPLVFHFHKLINPCFYVLTLKDFLLLSHIYIQASRSNPWTNSRDLSSNRWRFGSLTSYSPNAALSQHHYLYKMKKKMLISISSSTFAAFDLIILTAG